VEDATELRYGTGLPGECAVEQVEGAEEQHHDAGPEEVAAGGERCGGDVAAKPRDRDHVGSHARGGERGDDRVRDAAGYAMGDERERWQRHLGGLLERSGASVSRARRKRTIGWRGLAR